MKPFRHINAATLGEAVRSAGKKAKIIAGGTDVLGMLKNRAFPVYPDVLVNIKTVPGLDHLKEDAEGLTIGALVRLADIIASPLVREKYGILAEAARTVASPQIRSMGTLGGNLCQNTRCWYYRCSPFTGRDYHCLRKGGRVCYAVAGDNRYHAVMGGKGCFAVCPSDMAVALSALDAQVVITGKTGDRLIPVHDFYTPLGNVLKPHEILTEVRIPAPPAGSRQTFRKFSMRKAIDFAVVSVAAVISSEGGVCSDARIVLGAVAPAPIRANQAEAAIKGKTITAETAAEAAKTALIGARPLSRNAHKVEIAKTLVKRALLA